MQLSYVHGASDEPLKGQTVGDCFDASARRFPDREALVVRHQDVRWTYAELSRRVDAFAAGLLSLDLEPGARVGIWAPNCAEWVVAQFATAKAGLVLVNINPAYRLAELEFAINRVGCEALIVAPRLKSSDYIAMLGELCPTLTDCRPGRLHCKRLPTLRWLIRLGEESSPGFLNYDAVAARAEGGEATRERGDPARGGGRSRGSRRRADERASRARRRGRRADRDRRHLFLRLSGRSRRARAPCRRASASPARVARRCGRADNKRAIAAQRRLGVALADALRISSASEPAEPRRTS